MAKIKDLEYYKQNPIEAIEQVRFCGFECQGGDLEDNLAFQALEEFVGFAVGKLSPVEAKTDMVEYPSHYQNGKYEVIDEMLIVFGPQKTFDFCILNSWKYRARAPFKNKMAEDMDKSNRYLEYAKWIADAYSEVDVIKMVMEEKRNGTGQ